MEDEHESILLQSSRRRNKPSSMSLSCCFGGGGGHHRIGRSMDFDASFLSPAVTTPTPSKATTADHHRPGINTYTPFKSRKNRNRRNSSADFSYDPQSYALNFEDPSETEEPITSFTSRLPLSPPRSRADAVAEVKKNLEFFSIHGGTQEEGIHLPTSRRPRW